MWDEDLDVLSNAYSREQTAWSESKQIKILPPRSKVTITKRNDDDNESVSSEMTHVSDLGTIKTASSPQEKVAKKLKIKLMSKKNMG